MYKEMLDQIEKKLKAYIHCRVDAQIEREYENETEIAASLNKFAKDLYDEDDCRKVVSHWYTISPSFAEEIKNQYHDEIILETPFGTVWGSQIFYPIDPVVLVTLGGLI